jgi:ferredoxin-thioredoxin reductase catalytic subunit
MRFKFNLFALLYMIGPLVVIPYLAYSNNNWYLLFGILFSWFASFTTFHPRLRGFIFLFTVLCIGIWFTIGFNVHQYTAFFFFCSLGGYLCAQIAEHYDQTSKRGTLGNDAELKKHLEKNPEYLKDKMQKWADENPDKQLTFDVIDALARGRTITESDLAQTTINELTERALRNYYTKNPKVLEDKITKWRKQNPDKELTNDIIDALAKNKKGTLREE